MSRPTCVPAPGSLRFLTAAALALGAAAAPAGAAIQVPAEAPTIADGLAAAAPFDTVLVAPGTYVESLVLPSNVTLRAAGAPGSTVLEPSGDGTSVVCQATGPATRIEGLRLRGGSGVADGPIRLGGAVFVRGGELRLREVSIEDAAADFGGAVFLEDATLRWSAGRLERNRAGFGGALFARRGTVTLEDVEVADNQAQVGGGLYAVDVTWLQFARTTWRRNRADAEGGALFLENTASTADRSRFEANVAGTTGGAVHADQGATATWSYVTLLDNEAAFAGGGVYVRCEGAAGARCASVRLLHADLFGNTAASAGAAVVDGAAHLRLEASAVAANAGRPSCLDARAELEVLCTALAGNGPDPPDACLADRDGSVEADPFLCDLAGGDLRRCENSPLLNPPPCAVPYYGAEGGGCLTCGPTPAEATSWGRVKALYR